MASLFSKGIRGARKRGADPGAPSALDYALDQKRYENPVEMSG